MSNRQPVPPADRAALKRAALAQMLAEEGIGASPDPAIPHRAAATTAPLSYSQELLFLLDQGTAGLTAYNGPIARRLRGQVSPALMEQALDRLVRRHPALRTVFRPTEPATQTVLPHELLPLPRKLVLLLFELGAACLHFLRSSLQLDKLDEASLIEVDEPAPFRLGGLALLLEAGELGAEQFVIGRRCARGKRMPAGEEHLGP